MKFWEDLPRSFFEILKSQYRRKIINHQQEILKQREISK